MAKSTLVAGAFGAERTPQQVLIDALEEADNYDQIIIVALTKDRDVRTGWSTGRYLNHIGMLEFAKCKFVDDMMKD